MEDSGQVAHRMCLGMNMLRSCHLIGCQICMQHYSSTDTTGLQHPHIDVMMMITFAMALLPIVCYSTSEWHAARMRTCTQVPTHAADSLALGFRVYGSKLVAPPHGATRSYREVLQVGPAGACAGHGPGPPHKAFTSKSPVGSGAQETIGLCALWACQAHIRMFMAPWRYTYRVWAHELGYAYAPGGTRPDVQYQSGNLCAWLCSLRVSTQTAVGCCRTQGMLTFVYPLPHSLLGATCGLLAGQEPPYACMCMLHYAYSEPPRLVQLQLLPRQH